MPVGDQATDNSIYLFDAVLRRPQIMASYLGPKSTMVKTSSRKA
jgi:hypothetical protein